MLATYKNKMSIGPVIFNNSNRFPNQNSPAFYNQNSNNIKPFYLYKGLNPEREEELKIYPSSLSSSNLNFKLSIYPISYSSDSNSDSNLDANVNAVIKTNNNRNSFSSMNSNSSASSLHISDDENENDHLIKEISDDQDKNKVKYKCNFHGCRYKGTFLSKDYLRRHIREQHKRSREHICLGYHSNGEKWGCNKKFSRPYQLVNHWRGQRSLKRCNVPESELKKNGIL